MKSLHIVAFAVGAACAFGVSASGMAQELTEIAGKDYPQLLAQKRASAPACEAALQSGRWAAACDSYHSAAERVLSRRLIAVTWCEARIKELKQEQGDRISLPQACADVLSSDAAEVDLDQRIYTLKARMDPAGAERVEALKRQVLGAQTAPGTP